jgi:hypothetical protein
LAAPSAVAGLVSIAITLRDRRHRVRQYPSTARRIIAQMQSARTDARWSDAIRLTVSLWLFMLLIFLPAIIARMHGDNWGGVALDSATIIVSIGFGLCLFAVFRASIDMATAARIILLAAATLVVAAVQIMFDLLFTAWVAENLRASWSRVPVDLARASASLLNYVCVFTVNLALFQLSFTRRAALTAERQLAAARWAAQQAQLEALRLQLNPFPVQHAERDFIDDPHPAQRRCRTDDGQAFQFPACQPGLRSAGAGGGR